MVKPKATPFNCHCASYKTYKQKLSEHFLTNQKKERKKKVKLNPKNVFVMKRKKR